MDKAILVTKKEAMKVNDIKGLSAEDLQTKVKQERITLSKLKLNHAISPAENPLKIREARRNVARFLTELNTRTQA